MRVMWFMSLLGRTRRIFQCGGRSREIADKRGVTGPERGICTRSALKVELNTVVSCACVSILKLNTEETNKQSDKPN